MITRLSVLRSFTTASPAVSFQDEISNLERFWEKNLPWYNVYNSQLSLKAYRTLAPFLHLDKAKKVLEIGGGTGAGAAILIPQLSSGATYTLTDYIECFIKEARSRQLPNTEVIKCRPNSLPFSGETFDRFIALATIEELDTTKKILQEAYRVLQPGGILSASISGKRESDTYRQIIEKVKTKFNLTSGLKFRSELKHVGMIFSLFESAGFRRLIKFYENVQFGSDDIEVVKSFFMQDPSIAEQPAEKLGDISRYLDRLLNDLIKTEGVPVGTDYLFILAYKG